MKKILLFIVFFSTSLLTVFAQDGTDCAFLDAGEDDEVGCAGGPCTELSATVNFDLLGGGDNTSSYIVGPVNCPLEVEQGTPVSVNIDDRWSSVIDMTFDFSFFGNTYNQLLIGSNGVLTFDTADAGEFCPWSFDETAPDPNLITNAIFGAYHDIDPSVCGQIEYYITGTAPFRAFVVNFNQICHFSCNSLQTSQHIILYETSNIIDVYIDDKPTCTTWNDGNALLGIQNESGTIAYTPPNRNTGPWTATNEQWRFVPDDNYTVDSQLTWYDENGSVVSNELDVMVCPTVTTTYTAELSYNLNGTDYVITDDVTITVYGESSVEAFPPENMEDCATLGYATFDLESTIPTVLGNQQTTATVSFFETELDADNNTNPILDPANYTTSIFTTIWVRVSDQDTLPCYALTSFDVNPIVIDINEADDIEECSVYPNSLDGEFDLSAAGDQIINGQTGLTVSYFLSSDDATNQANEITQTNPYTSETTTIWVRVDDIDSQLGCFALTSFNIIVRPTPEITQPADIEICSTNPGEEFSNFDLESQTDAVANGQTNVTITYHESLDDADAAINALMSPYTNLSNPQTIYVRLSNLDGCYNTTTFELIVSITPIANAPQTLESCSANQGGNTALFELTDASEDVINGQQDVTVTYYTTATDALAGSNALTNTLYDGASTTFYVRIESGFGCFSTTSVDVLVNGTPIANQPISLRECNEGDGYAIYNLDAQVDEILDGQADVEVSFYTSQSDAMDGAYAISANDLEAYTTLAGIIYVRAENMYSGCYSITNFELFVENCIPEVPNGFSPNGDNMNDIFSIERLENVFYDYTMTIYNRWGNVVFEGNRSTSFWDGSVDGVISTDPTGATYFYVLNFNDGENAPLKGWVYVNP